MKKEIKVGHKVVAIAGQGKIRPGESYKVRKILKDEETGMTQYKLEGVTEPHDAWLFERDTSEEIIVIKTDGTNTSAYYRKGGRLLGSAKAKRNPMDPHNLKVLACLVLNRTLPDDGSELAVKPEGYTGSLCVINSRNNQVQDGRILEFIGGKAINAPVGLFDKRGYVNVLPNMHQLYKFRTLDQIKNAAKDAKNGYFDVLELHRR